jgi:hypothetical protein
MVSIAILGLVSVIGMGRAKNILDMVVVLRLLILVAYDKTDRRSCGRSFEHTGKHLHLIALLALANDLRLTGPSAVELRLNEVHIEGDTGRASIDNSANGSTMRLAKRSKPEKDPESIARHIGTNLGIETAAAPAAN